MGQGSLPLDVRKVFEKSLISVTVRIVLVDGMNTAPMTLFVVSLNNETATNIEAERST